MKKEKCGLCMGAILVRKSVYPYTANNYRLFHPVPFKHSKLSLDGVFTNGEWECGNNSVTLNCRSKTMFL